MRFLVPRSPRSSVLGSGSPPNSRLRLSAQSFTVLGLSPSSSQTRVMGRPVEMAQPAVSRLNSSVYFF